MRKTIGKNEQNEEKKIKRASNTLASTVPALNAETLKKNLQNYNNK
jgi:hypothetical protein